MTQLLPNIMVKHFNHDLESAIDEQNELIQSNDDEIRRLVQGKEQYDSSVRHLFY